MFADIHHGGRWIYPGSFGSLAHALEVARFTRALPGDCSICLGSLCSLAHTPGVVGFIRDRWVFSSATWGYLRSFTIVGFTRACHGGRWIDPGSVGSLSRAIWIVGFNRGR